MLLKTPTFKYLRMMLEFIEISFHLASVQKLDPAGQVRTQHSIGK